MRPPTKPLKSHSYFVKRPAPAEFANGLDPSVKITKEQPAPAPASSSTAAQEDGQPSAQRRDRESSLERCQGCDGIWRRPLPNLDSVRLNAPAKTVTQLIKISQDMVESLRDQNRKFDAAHEDWRWRHSRCVKPASDDHAVCPTSPAAAAMKPLEAPSTASAGSAATHAEQPSKRSSRKLKPESSLGDSQQKASSSLISNQHPIETWRNTATTEVEKQSQSVVARIFEICQESLRCLLQNLDLSSVPKRDRNILGRCHAVLLLWGEGHGVSTGALDSILNRSKSLRQMTLSILNPMCKALSRGLRYHIPSAKHNDAIKGLMTTAAKLNDQIRLLLVDANEDISESESDSESSCDEGVTDNLQELAQTIKVYTDSLTDLSSALACPALEPEYDNEPSAVTPEPRFANDYHTELIRAKFPRAEMILLQCLGRASWDRYLRMQRERDFNAHTISIQDGKSRFSKSEFQDSGIGTSLPHGASTYAETLLSFATSISGGKRVDIPPLPPGAKKGVPFECNACGNSIKATNNRDWRKHLFMDLRPYTCFFANCAFVDNPFSNRQLWVGHLEIEHGFGPTWEGIQCPLCLEHTENGKGAVLTHFARHMEDIALAALPRGVDSDVESDSETSVRSDSVRGLETTVDEYIRGIGGSLESSPAPNHAPQPKVSFDKNQGGANMDPGPNILREGQEEKSPGAIAYYDPVYERYRDTHKPDGDLSSSSPRQTTESTDIKLQEAANPSPALLMRNDDGNEVSDRPPMSIRDVEPRKRTNRRNPQLVEWRAERKAQKQRAFEAQNTFKKAVDLNEGGNEANREPRRPISRCNNCKEDKKSCLRNDRQWPAKCDRCNELGLSCSESSVFVGRRIIDKMPGDPSSLDPDPTMQVPPARENSHQDIDTADPTWDFSQPLESYSEAVAKITHHPFSSSEWGSGDYKKSSSGSENPEQSNASALEAAEKRFMYVTEFLDGNWANSALAMAAAFSDDVTPLSAPATRPTPDNAESKQPETGSYDTTRSTYFYSDDTSHPDTRRRDQTPTTRRPQLPLSPTTMTAEPSWRNTSDSANTLDPAMNNWQTTKETREKHFRMRRQEMQRLEAIESMRKRREKAEAHRNKNLKPPPPSPRDTTPDYPVTIPSASQPEPTPAEPELGFDDSSDFDFSPTTAPRQ